MGYSEHREAVGDSMLLLDLELRWFHSEVPKEPMCTHGMHQYPRNKCKISPIWLIVSSPFSNNKNLFVISSACFFVGPQQP